LPEVLNVTTPALSEQTVLVEESMLNVTGRPLVAVALGVNVSPMPVDDGLEIVPIVCGAGVTDNVPAT